MNADPDRKCKTSAGRGRLRPSQLAHIVRRTSRFEAGEPLEKLTTRPPLSAGMSPFEMFRR